MEIKTSTGKMESEADDDYFEAKRAQLYHDHFPGEASNANLTQPALNVVQKGTHITTLQEITHTAEVVNNELHSTSGHDRGTKCRWCAWDNTKAKAVLEKALRKANTAVFLDRNVNPKDAKERYESACKLLRQVYIHNSSPDDRRKLKRIRARYSVRIEELAALIPDQSLSSIVQLEDTDQIRINISSASGE
ncbi:hypothetical protein BCR34DRAFT_62980 [Clohesyomyces aquaticus]|uniref:MIT domain-containing protein n=1 Tax=Clohesyomyces aquaticus TaxID=1231657 RepID=A0A1Y2A3T3_9PLEO|nr:hypothetical protein BCR34DRAFT_62980 [Clohesyomyces aquaticus]